MKSVWPPKPEWIRAPIREALACPNRSTCSAVLMRRHRPVARRSGPGRSSSRCASAWTRGLRCTHEYSAARAVEERRRRAPRPGPAPRTGPGRARRRRTSPTTPRARVAARARAGWRPAPSRCPAAGWRRRRPAPPPAPRSGAPRRRARRSTARPGRLDLEADVHGRRVEHRVAVRPGHLAVHLRDDQAAARPAGLDRGRQHVDLGPQRQPPVDAAGATVEQTTSGGSRRREQRRHQRQPRGQVGQGRAAPHARPDERRLVHDPRPGRDTAVGVEHEQPVRRHRGVQHAEHVSRGRPVSACDHPRVRRSAANSRPSSSSVTVRTCQV